MRLAVFGGTFDPPHIGHLIHAQYAYEQLAVERVLFIPAADPPHKQGDIRASAEHRVHMTELAIAGNSAFSLSRLDVDRPGPHYSVDMLELVRQQIAPDELFFLIGADSLRDLPQWHQPQRLLELCRLAVFPRAHVHISLDELETVLPTISDRVIFLDSPLIDISSTDIVARLQMGKGARYLVAEAVFDYIRTYRLYENEILS